MMALGALVLAAAMVPAHVQNWYWYGLNNVNNAVPPAMMVKYADFAEDDGFGAEHAMAFKRAGGRYAVAYTDPAYVPYCHPPFAPPGGHCEGPVGNLVTAEDAWFHGPDGTRVRHYVGGEFDHQEALNPASPSAHRAWHQKIEKLRRDAPALDFIFADDSGGSFLGPDGTPNSGWFYGFNAPAVEIRSPDAFLAAWSNYLGESRIPMIVNGFEDHAGRPSYGGALLRLPFVRGESHETCFRGGDGIQTGEKWRLSADALLAVTAMQRWAVCMIEGKPTAENRVYTLASWWLTYDPRWSVVAPLTPVERSTVMPELDIVPTEPVRGAGAHVDALRTASGAYVREFRACYQRRIPIGACAAIVNPNPGTVALPPLRGHYGRTLVLAGGDVLAGGYAAWSRGTPASVPGGSATILRADRD